jgi:hypothetical protein
MYINTIMYLHRYTAINNRKYLGVSWIFETWNLISSFDRSINDITKRIYLFIAYL